MPLVMGEWIRSRNANTSSVLQIGANDGSESLLHPELAQLCVQMGWQATLVEPIPYIYKKLYRRVGNRNNVRVLNGAACGVSCEQQQATMWFVNTSSTQHWGSKESDPRCARVNNARFVNEIASLDINHLYKHVGVLNNTPGLCRECSMQLIREARKRRASRAEEASKIELPSNCMSRIVQDNIQSLSVQCICLAEEAHALRSLTLLLIDAEGYDYEILSQWPFDTAKPLRIGFEAVHLSSQKLYAASNMLCRNGYVSIPGRHRIYGQLPPHKRHTQLHVWHLLSDLEAGNKAMVMGDKWCAGVGVDMQSRRHPTTALNAPSKSAPLTIA